MANGQTDSQVMAGGSLGIIISQQVLEAIMLAEPQFLER
jgi:hypothetical protein